ncbi:MAG: nucleotide exchange factor GrpE [Anaerolineae bacterium]
MPDKKQRNDIHEEDEMEEGTMEAPEMHNEELEALQKRVDEAEARVKMLEAKSAENLDGWQRAVAEFQNYKKRIDRDRESDKAIMKGDLIKRFLPVLDDLERALQNRPEEDSWASGIDLIRRKLQSILAAEGLKRIEAEGTAFDPNFHEAISYEPADGVESGRVIGVVQNGYMLGDYVVRPAMVRVAR